VKLENASQSHLVNWQELEHIFFFTFSVDAYSLPDYYYTCFLALPPLVEMKSDFLLVPSGSAGITSNREKPLERGACGLIKISLRSFSV
jgi:hypothetical protein